MMDCKKALQECGGDIEEAATWLRKKVRSIHWSPYYRVGVVNADP